MTSIEDIKKKIEEALPGSKVEIKNPRKDGVHLEAYVEYHGFKDIPLLEQHRMIHNALGDILKEIHALGIHTSIPKTKEETQSQEKSTPKYSVDKQWMNKQNKK